MAWTYLLICSDGSYYVGSTRDLEVRLEQHELGRVNAYTARRRPVRLAWAAEFERVDDAWSTERQIHGWSRAKKQALVDGNIDVLKHLSRNRQAGTSQVDEASSSSATVPANQLSHRPHDP